MKTIFKNDGHILVKLLIILISISVMSTALLNVHLNARQQIYYEDWSSLMSMQARAAFDRLNYHIRLAGYGNTEYRNPVEVFKGELSDSLTIWHNDVRISFFVDYEDKSGTLYESIDGSLKGIVSGIKSIKLDRSKLDLMTIELVLNQNDPDSSDKILSRSYSTSIRIEHN